MRRLTAFLASAVWALGISALAYAAGGEAFTDPEQAGPDFKVQGEYEGTIGNETKFGAQVIALGDGKFDVVLFTKGLPGGPKDAAWDGKTKVMLKGETKEGVVLLSGQNFKGEIKGGTISGTAEEDVKYEAKKVERKSPTLGAKPPEGAIVLFDGTNVDAWQNGKLVEKDLLAVGTRTKQKFEDFTLHLEFRTPFMPKERGQQRGNSGMYLVDQYECQVLDSFGLSGENNECGGIYTVAKPIVNMCLPPLSWQTYLRRRFPLRPLRRRRQEDRRRRRHNQAQRYFDPRQTQAQSDPRWRPNKERRATRCAVPARPRQPGAFPEYLDRRKEVAG